MVRRGRAAAGPRRRPRLRAARQSGQRARELHALRQAGARGTRRPYRGGCSARERQARAAFTQRGDRDTFFPARIAEAANADGDGHDSFPSIITLNWAGSADLRTVAGADGFAVFPAGDREFPAGEIVGFLPMR